MYKNYLQTIQFLMKDQTKIYRKKFLNKLTFASKKKGSKKSCWRENKNHTYHLQK